MEKEREAYLIAYFAIKGKELSAATSQVAAKLGEALTRKGIKFDQFAIVPVETYPTEAANFEFVAKEEKENRARPELVGKYSGMKDVKDLFLVVPNWYDSLPMGVFTFLDEYDFSGKRIVPVVLHSGDGPDHVVAELRKYLHKCWIMPAVEVESASVPDSCEDKINAAIEEMLEESKSKY
jgi:hypothetical protein